MAKIIFDCFIDTQAAGGVLARFEALNKLLVRDKTITEATVAHDPQPQIAKAVEAQLLQVISEQDEERGTQTDTRNFGMQRFTVDVSGARSLNQVAMLYSRILTPAAHLPKDSVQLMNEQAFELPVAYPWTLSIQP